MQEETVFSSHNQPLQVVSALIILFVSLLFAIWGGREMAGNTLIAKARTLEQISRSESADHSADSFMLIEETYKNGLKNAPEYGWGHYLYAKFLFNQVLLQRAYESYQNAFRYFDSIDLYKETGITLYYLKEPEKALKYLNSYLHFLDNDPVALQIAGLCNLELQQYAVAADLLSKSLAIREDANIWNFLGVCHSYQKEYEKSLKPFEKAVELDPKLAPVYKNLAALYGYQLPKKDYQKAYESYQKYLLLNPSDPENRIILRRITYLKLRHERQLEAQKIEQGTP